MSFEILELPTFADERGRLTVLESTLPFNVVRMYWIYGADSKTRGGHRHHKTRQALICIHGKVSVYMCDGVSQKTIDLADPCTCLIVEPKDWHLMTFGSNSVLLVLSSEPYDRKDYIDAPYSTTAQ
jgi:hypothetical protein